MRPPPARDLAALLTVAAVAGFVFFGGAEAIDAQRRLMPGDAQAFSVGRALYSEQVVRVVRVLTDAGSSLVTGAVTGATAIWALARSRRMEAAGLVLALIATFLLIHLAKAVEGRPRPPGSLVATTTDSYPSGHAAYAVAFIACAVVLMRSGHSVAARRAAIAGAALVAVLVGLSRIYLRAHYLSDVIGGLAFGAAVFAACALAGFVVASIRHNGAR